jgi:lysine N6-hydroxylase
MIHTQQHTPEKSFDIIGIGIGPFNLGLSALLHKIPQMTRIFFDESNKFNWHHGMEEPPKMLVLS